MSRRQRFFAATFLVVVVLLAGGWFWLRGSSLVAIRSVTVTGVAGPNVEAIERALQKTARSMTTLDVSVGKLKAAIDRYSYVDGLSVETKFPHGLTINVSEQVPIARIVSGSHAEVIDADGEVLNGSVAGASSLPTLSASSLPDGGAITDSATVAAVKLLAAAPYSLISHVQTVRETAAHGLVVQLRNGPVVYFGAANAAAAQWQALVAVLANSSSQGAGYIDVSNANRPAAG